jgi:hypothetical protein
MKLLLDYLRPHGKLVLLALLLATTNRSSRCSIR